MDCNELSGPLPSMNYEAIKICYADYSPGFGTPCTEHGVIGNNFSCPLPPGAAEHCHAKCAS